MFRNLISATMIALITTTTVASAANNVVVNQPTESESNAKTAALSAGGTVAAGTVATYAVLSAAGIAAVPHAAGGMILISTATGASYIAGTLGIVGGAVACVASVVCGVAVVGGVAVAVGTGYYVVEKIKAQPIEFDDVMTGKKLRIGGNSYYSIKKKYLTSESRDELWAHGTDFETASDIGMFYKNVVVTHGTFRNTYYVDKATYDTLKKEFKENGLYEAKD
jgi:hypothetical protein